MQASVRRGHFDSENNKDQERRDMSDDNTQDAAEPSPASAGSVAPPHSGMYRCDTDPPSRGVYVLAYWCGRGYDKETMSARVARRGVPLWYDRNGVELVEPDFWMPLPEDCGQ
jgi:hypothetical protein